MKKTIRSILTALPLPETQSILKLELSQMELSSKNITGLVLKSSNILLRKLEVQMMQKQYETCEIILAIVKQLLQYIRIEDVFQVQLLKIKYFYFTLKIDNFKAQKDSKIKKIKFFIQNVQNNLFFPLIQEDFYSKIQLIYLQAGKSYLREGFPKQAIKLIKKCFETIKRQISCLLDLLDIFQEEKIKKIIQNKGRILEELFFLQHGTRRIISEFASQSICHNILPKYSNILTKIGYNLDPQLIAIHQENVFKQQQKNIPQISESSEKDQQEDSKQIEYMKKSQNNSRKQLIAKGIIQSFNFIANIKNSKQKQKLIAQNGRTSIQNKLGNSLKNSTTKQSRFHQELHSLKENIKSISLPGLNHQNRQSCKLDEIKRKKSSLINRNRGFSLVIRQEEIQKDLLKNLNPFRNKSIFNTQKIKIPSAGQMIRNGFLTFAGNV